MRKPLFERNELVYIGRVLGALLVLFGGVALLLQAYFVDLLPPRDGFDETQAIVIDLEQTGSFQSPSFLVTLEYDILGEAQSPEMVRSSLRVDFEQYFQLAIGQLIDIHYDPQDVVQWRIEPNNGELSQYGLGLLMVVFGAFSLSFPRLVSWASRQEDFEFKDELDDDLVAGANFHE